MVYVGAAKVDITPDCIGVGMLGWGDPAHRVRGTKSPLFARAIVIKAGFGRLIFVCVELCFVTEALRAAVFEQLSLAHPDLGIKGEELLITATHTHNAPGGHSQYLFYNLTVPGFQPQIFETYRNGITSAIAQAFQNATPAEIHVSAEKFSTDSKVAFNRSLKAWRRNPEAKAGEEVDRTMTVMRMDRVDASNGGPARPIACINWFPVHCTSIHRDFHYIHSDNKGIAARLLESSVREESGNEQFVAIFAQGAAGDVTPNFVKHKGLREIRGPFRDDEKSCEFNAQLQFELAKKIYDQAASGAGGAAKVEGGIDALLERHDFSKLEVAPGIRTGPAAIGCNMLRGTDEGRGAPDALIALAVLISRISHYLRYLAIRLRGKHVKPPWRLDPVQGPKIPFMVTGRGRVLGASRPAKLILPGWIHPIVRNLKRMAGVQRRDRTPFTPQILPLQIIKVGPLALAAVPAEFTTVSGKRLIATLEQGLKAIGVERVILCGYANAYAGYVATYEEYQVQAYEGSSTHFGMWTLAGYQVVFSAMCLRLATRLIERVAAEEAATHSAQLRSRAQPR